MEDFVPYELAVKLKEKGFNEVCYDYYEPLKHCLNQIKTPWTNKEGESYGVITAPTISQVLKWLREEKKIFIDIRTSIDLNGKEHFSYYIIHNKVSIREGYTDFDWKFELAVLAGIEYVIDNLI